VFVSALEFSGFAGVVAVEAVPGVVSEALVESWGTGVPVEAPVADVGVVAAEGVVASVDEAGAEAAGVLVTAFEESLAGGVSLFPQPLRASGRASKVTATKEGRVSFIGFF
jgi:hypothetical protein